MKCLLPEKAGIHAFTRCLRVQLKGSRIVVVELAPPGVETKLFQGEFATEMKGKRAMPIDVLVAKAIAGIEAGKTEIRPGLSNVLYLMSRLLPALPFGQMAKDGADRAVIPRQKPTSTACEDILGSWRRNLLERSSCLAHGKVLHRAAATYPDRLHSGCTYRKRAAISTASWISTSVAPCARAASTSADVTCLPPTCTFAAITRSAFSLSEIFAV